MLVKIQKLHPDAVIPTYAHHGDACFDLTATTVEQGLSGKKDHQYLGWNKPVICNTGLAIEVPLNSVMLIFSRSGHGFNYGIRLANCVGVIDSTYRGEVKVKLTCDEPNAQRIAAGDRIAQAMIIPIPAIEFDLVDQLSETERGANGFGSTS